MDNSSYGAVLNYSISKESRKEGEEKEIKEMPTWIDNRII